MSVLVPPIVAEPSPHGILGGCIEVVSATDPHQLLGTETMPISCSDAQAWQDECQTGQPPAPKVFNRPGLCESDPVTIVAGVECSALGLTYTEGVARARESLRMGEQRALEEWFATRLCDMAQGNDLTPAAGAVPVHIGVALLEGFLGRTYSGPGIIHVPMSAAALLGRDITAQPTACHRTLAGSGIVVGAGYDTNIGGPGCTQAPAGEIWLYATPPIRVRQDEVRVVPDTDAASVDTRLNDRRVMAERTSVIETACCTAAMVRVMACGC